MGKSFFKKFKEEILISATCVVAILSIYVWLVVMKSPQIQTLEIAKVQITAELDVTWYQKRGSLAHGKEKQNCEASLVFFKEKTRYELDQKFVKKPMSVMLFDERGQYIEIVRLQPKSEQLKNIQYKSNNLTKYALEFSFDHPLMDSILRGTGPVRLPIEKLQIKDVSK